MNRARVVELSSRSSQKILYRSASEQNMERRSFLRGVTLSLPASVAGCLDGTGQTDSTASPDDREDGSDDTSPTAEPSTDDDSDRDPTPSERSDRDHSLYVENQTDRSRCTSVVVEADEPIVDGSYLVNAEEVLEFADVLTGDSATIRLETDEYDHRISWTSGECPHEGSYYRSVAVQLTENGIESAVDQCDAIVAGPYDDRTDAPDAKRCDSRSTDEEGA